VYGLSKASFHRAHDGRSPASVPAGGPVWSRKIGPSVGS